MDDEDDKRLFREAVRNVKRLRPAQPRPQKRKPRARAVFARRDEQEVLRESLELRPGDLFVETGDEISFRRAGVHDTLLRKLRRGDYRCEAELDLHGYTAAEARQELREFLEAMMREHCRCVRIIHGKGLRSKGDGPVLKQRVDAWLRQRKDVLAFVSARREHGGTGAVYVLLRAPAR